MRVETNKAAFSWWAITNIGSLKLVLRLNIPKTIWEIKSKKSEQRYFQFFINKFCLHNEIAKIDKIESESGIANNLWVSRSKHCLFKDKHRWADQVDDSLTPMNDWNKVRDKGNVNNILHQNGDWFTSLDSLVSSFWLIIIDVIRRKKAVKRWAETE